MNPSLQQEWLALQKRILQKNPEELEKELQKQITEKLAGYLAAIPLFCLELYKYQRAEETIPVVWREGSSSLFRYEGYRHCEESTEGGMTRQSSVSDKERWIASSRSLRSAHRNDETFPFSLSPYPLLIIPSLINRHYILDLEEDNSFVKYLSGKGIDTYLASWGEPEKNELEFTLDDYISRIRKMIDTIYEKTGKQVILTGYCMGGLLSMAAAINRSDKIKAIAFFATPWDFHAEEFPRFRLSAENLSSSESLLDSFSKIPAAFMQTLFYYMHANIIGHKFEMYPLINATSQSKGGFLAIENWVNDGISMAKEVARECFIGWVNNNNVAKLEWRNNGEVVSPERLAHLPVFFAIPQKDSIVPPSCALPLVDYFNNCKVITPNAGHVGMIVGNLAKTQTWEPFFRWIEKL